MTTILAEIKHRKEGEDGVGATFALLKPLYLAHSNSWGPIADLEKEFPHKGEVVWWNPPFYAQVGSVFKTTLVKVSVTDERHAVYRVDGDEQFDVFVDLRGEPDAVELRRMLASGGFSFGKKPIGRQLLHVPGTQDEWIGPLVLDFTLNQYSRWESGSASNTGFVTIRNISEDSLQEIVIHDSTYRCLRPDETLGGSIGKFSAQSDQKLIESLLKRLRRINANTTAALNVTKEVFHKYVIELSNAQLIDSLDEIEHVREEALGLLMAKLDEDTTWAEATANSLLEHPRVSDNLDAAIHNEVRRRTEEIEEKLQEAVVAVEEKISKKQLESESLDDSLSCKQKKLIEIEKDIESKNAYLREFSDQATSQFLSLIDEILADPVKELGKHAVVRALASDPIQNESPSIGRKIRIEDSCYKSLDQCVGALDIIARTHQQSPSSLKVCLSALLSGRPVVIVGEGSNDLCSAFCEVIAKDFAGKVNVPTDIFSLSDFFEQPVSPVIDDGFSPVNLTEYFRQVSSLGTCFPLVLVGINRAPMETAFLDILLGSSSLSKSQVAVRAAGAQTKPNIIKIDRSVFFMTTLANGVSVFQPHPDFLRAALFVDAERATKEPISSMDEIKLPAMSISSQGIDEWRGEGQEVSNNAIKALVDTPNWLDGEFGSLREIGIFCQVFKNEAFGIAEWLLAKYGYSYTPSALLSLAQKCGGQIESALEDILGDADIDRIQEAGGNTSL